MGKPQSTGNLVNALAQDSSNNIGIGGAANASFKLQVTGATNLNGALTGTSADFSGNNHSLASNNTLRFTDTDTATEANQQIGKIEFYSSDTSTPGAGVKAYIGAFAQDTTPDAYLSFATQDGSATPNPVERLRISSEGLATFSSSVTATDQIKVSGSGAYLSIYDTQASSKNWAIRAGHDAVGDLAIRQSNSTGGDPVSAGTTRLYINNSGNVGIGTTSPTTKLHVFGVGTTYAQIQGTAGNTTGLLTNNNSKTYFTGTYYNVTDAWEVADITAGGLTRMCITSGGNVGIGTTSPSYKLQVQSTSGTIARITDGTNNLDFYAGSGLNEIAATTSLLLSTNNATRLTISSTGAATFSSNVGINGGSTNFPLVVKVATNQNLRVSTETHTSVQAINDAVSAFVTLKVDGSTLLLNSQSGGNVGIGTSSPQMPLSVQANTGNGAIRLIGTPNASSNNAGIYWYDSNDSTFNGYLGNFSTSFDIYNQRSTPMAFYTNATERMRILSNSDRNQVVIGTDTVIYTSANRTNLTLGTTGTVLFGMKISGVSKGYLYHDGNEFQIVGDGISNIGLYPQNAVNAGADNAYTMGASGRRWSAVWAANGTIQTSDARQKKDITPTNLGLDFILALKPVSYKWKVGGNKVETIESKDENKVSERILTPIEGKRNHYGLIAQEVKEVLGDIDFGGYVYDEETDTMALRYDQFISPMIKAIQEQTQIIKDLEARIKQLENK